MLRFALLSVFIISCGTCMEIDYYESKNDGRFNRYSQYFDLITGHDTRREIIFYGKVSNPKIIIGECHIKKNIITQQTIKYIVINKSLFDNLSVNWRRAVIAHELVHCHLAYKKHSSDPEDLMFYALPTGEYLSDMWLEYMLSFYKKRSKL